MIKKLEQSTSNELVSSPYLKLSTEYFNTQYNDVQKLLKHLSMACPFNISFPVLKLLRSVCAYLLINELESVFFAYVIETNGWNINDSIIRKYRHEVKQVLFYTSNSEEYKAITLYLLLCGYTSKFYLNECTDMYLVELEKACSDFKVIFSQWVKQQAHTTLKINPQSLNKVYKKIFLNPKPEVLNFDYNSLVDDILIICPSYNPSERERCLEMQKQQKLLKSTHQHPLKISTTVANLPILTSSGLLQQIGINPNNASINSIILTESIQQNKRASFGLNSSEFGIKNLGVPEDQNDILDFHIGFRECHSDNQDNGSKDGGKETMRERKTTNGHAGASQGTVNTSSYFY